MKISRLDLHHRGFAWIAGESRVIWTLAKSAGPSYAVRATALLFSWPLVNAACAAANLAIGTR
jgi:hypothetical protein